MMNKRRRLTGVVASNKMQKTVVVVISRTYQHPLYRKVVHTQHKIKAHDELGCEVGDLVQIVESRPISAQTRFVVESIMRKAVEPEVLADEPVAVSYKPEVAEETEETEKIEKTEKTEEEQGA